MQTNQRTNRNSAKLLQCRNSRMRKRNQVEEELIGIHDSYRIKNEEIKRYNIQNTCRPQYLRDKKEFLIGP